MKEAYSDDDLDNAIETLIDSKEILENSELMKLIKTYSKDKVKKITSVAELRSAAYEFNDSVNNGITEDSEPDEKEPKKPAKKKAKKDDSKE